MVGQAFATTLLAKANEVMIGTRDVANALAKPGNPNMGTPAFADWHAAHPGVQLGTFADAAAFGEVLINVTSGGGSLAALDSAGADNLG